MIDPRIGKRIKESRERLGLTQEQFAEKAGFTANYISTLERGKSFPRTQFLAEKDRLCYNKIVAAVLRRAACTAKQVLRIMKKRTAREAFGNKMSKKQSKKHGKEEHKKQHESPEILAIREELSAEKEEEKSKASSESPAGGNAPEGNKAGAGPGQPASADGARAKEDVSEPPPDYPALIDGAMAQLARFHLNQRTQRELRSLMELLVHCACGDVVKSLRYGLLLQCDNDDYACAFLAELSRILEDAKLLLAKPVFLAEEETEEFLEDWDELDEPWTPKTPKKERPNRLRVVGICTSDPPEQEKEQYLRHWEKFWETEEKFLKAYPELIGVAIVSEKAVRNRWRKYENLFYRVYAHHIFLNDLPADDIRDMVFAELADLHLEMDEDFRQALEAYIRTVYPKADLKYNSFVSDLVDRLLTAYYSAAELEGKLTTRCIPYYRRPRGFDEALAGLDGRVGMEPLKKAFQELYYQKQSQERTRTPLRLNMVFEGNPGTGKTTAARMAADILYSMGLTRTNKLVSVKSADLISPWVGQTAQQTQNICRKAYGGVLFIDEAYMLAYTPLSSGGRSANDDHKSQCVDTILQEMEENADKLTVIFAGYPKPMQKFLDSNEGLRSRITKIIHFPDFTDEQLLEIFEQLCAADRFTVAEDAWPALKSRIAFEKTGEHFGNARSIENVYHSIRAAWQTAPGEERVFTAAHIQSTMPQPQRSDLGDMIGLEDLKEQLLQFEKRVKYLKLLGEKGAKAPPMNLHMLFEGNPGTGKTTVARIIAEDLYRIGVLKTNKCICVETHDLLGGGLNAAAPLEREIQRAMGGVLFLDEAYALTEYTYGSTGKEIVAALITAMEKYRGELMVIFAGYPRNMRAFLSANPGLRSRIGHNFVFRDYNVQELTDIFLAKMQKYGFILSDGVTDRVREIMEYFHVIPEFGNGRFVDNLIDQTIDRRAMRDDGDLSHYSEICAGDIPSIRALLDSMPDGLRYVDPSGITQEEKWRTAVHETGHALATLLLEPGLKLISISTADQAFSYGRVKYDYPGHTRTETQLMHHISIALAGRAAERLIFGTHCSGCSSDYAEAKRTASNMLEHYAMGNTLGARDIAPLLNAADKTAMRLLKEHEETLRALARELLEKKELTDEDIRSRLTVRPSDARPSEIQPVDRRSPDTQPPDTPPPNTQPSNARSPDAQLPDARPSGGESAAPQRDAANEEEKHENE